MYTHARVHTRTVTHARTHQLAAHSRPGPGGDTLYSDIAHPLLPVRQLSPSMFCNYRLRLPRERRAPPALISFRHGCTCTIIASAPPTSGWGPATTVAHAASERESDCHQDAAALWPLYDHLGTSRVVSGNDSTCGTWLNPCTGARAEAFRTLASSARSLCSESLACSSVPSTGLE